MSSYKTGTVTVTNGSATVTGVGTAWQTNGDPVAAGDLLAIDGVDVAKLIESVESDTSLTLSSSWAGDTAAGGAYQITRDFVPGTQIPIIQRGDINPWAIFNDAMLRMNNLLSDEIVGEFTPYLFGASVAGTNGYSVQKGIYVRKPNTCWVSIKCSLSSKDAAMAGAARLGGLPFNSADITDSTSLLNTLYSNVTFPAGRTQAYGSVGPNTDYVNLGATGSAVAVASITAAEVASNSVFFLSGTYLVTPD